jgi:hypothetical protein
MIQARPGHGRILLMQLGETGDHIIRAARVGENISNLISSEVEDDRVRFLIIGWQRERSAETSTYIYEQPCVPGSFLVRGLVHNAP